MRFTSLVVAAALASASMTASATSITYNLSESFFENSIFVSGPTEVSAVGTITTNGTIGVLTQADITSFTLTLAANSTSASFNSNTGFVLISGSDLTATTSGLFFNYADSAGGVFTLNANNGLNSLCDVTAGYEECDSLVAPQEFRVNATTYDNLGGTFSYQEIATATTVVTPESSSILLLGTGLLSVAGVIRKRLA